MDVQRVASILEPMTSITLPLVIAPAVAHCVALRPLIIAQMKPAA